MRILLTGSSGMVGRNLLEHSDITSFEVITPSHSELDLLDYQSVDEFLRFCKPDMVIHAAGIVGGIQANIRNPVKFFIQNLDMGRNIIWASRQNGVKHLINLGSSCMYPRNAPNPLREEIILSGELEPSNEGYALAKIAATRLCQYIHHEDADYQYKTLIPCNLYGRWDKFDPIQSHLIAAIIQKVHEALRTGAKQVEIWGDGNVRREFMYAGDFADCLIHAIKHFDSLPYLMNVGVGRDYTVNEYYKLIAEVMGYSGSFVHDTSKPVGMQNKLVDITKQTECGWQKNCELKKGLAATYDFYLKQGAN
ncbi:MAG: GDP-L-fucose synthase [Syntrophomonas sp.]|nr:GDP-L-fucose synthase [Syntrophomonas sp.]